MSTILSSMEPESEGQQPRFWRVRLKAVWRDEILPEPIGEQARAVASQMDVHLCIEPEQYSTDFVVTAPRIGRACDQALALVDRMIEAAGLPVWQAVSFHVDEIPPPDGSEESFAPGGFEADAIDLESV